MKTPQVESFDDIVFEHRNQEYGAYELRKRYPKRGTIALAVSLFVLMVAVGVPLIASYMKQRDYNKYLEKQTTIEMEKVKVEVDEVKPPPPPPPPPEVKEVKFRPPVIVDTLTKEETEIMTVEEAAEIGNTGPVDTTTQIVEIVEEVAPVVDVPVEMYAIQEKPTFPGGDAGLMEYIAKNVKYPPACQENGVEGTVYIRFVVTKTGSVGEVQVTRGADPLLDEEALRVIKTLPAWSPGKNNGNPVSVWFNIPIKFKLN